MLLRRLLPLLAVPAALLVAPRARATTIQARSMKQMSLEADQVLVGEVVSAQAAWEDGTIWTTYDLRVVDWVKPGRGGKTAHALVKQLGGVVGDEGMLAEGVPQFQPGDEVMLFTKDYGGGWQSVHNCWQGALKVTHRKAGARDERVVEGLTDTFPEEAAATTLAEIETRVRRHAGVQP
jgi:hypothetical protein